MLQLLLGIVLFFGIHSASIVALPWRDTLAAKSEQAWKAVYAIISIVGIVLIVRGYADVRQAPTILYVTPAWLRHVAALLMLPVFAFFIAPYFPGRIKTALKHPQLIAVKAWAVAHLLVNGALADVLLFGSFLLWAVADRISLKNRVARPLAGAPESKFNDAIVVVLGLALYVAFAFWLHESLFGIAPFA
ncbi:MAG: NnrU family protein [Gammaproteobacteria bacterium]|nr:NnrU family protein [Gammaproteobacteria bacterium]MDH3430528.1 NnrU family protein [Gammaproteobacteria bacterium]MDH3433823.1 NnrU family protein [Gammaproteobacteria bacterium]